jgi:hypothetical protein
LPPISADISILLIDVSKGLTAKIGGEFEA